MLGQRWHHIGLMFSHFMGILWFVLAFVGQELGPYWAYLGPLWAMLGHFGPCWNHIGLILGHFGLFSDLCRPLFLDLGISMSLNFRPCKAFAKTPKIPGKIQFVDCVADCFCCYFFCFFLGAFAWSRDYVGPLWAMSAILLYPVVCVCLCWAILGVFCGLCWPLLGKSWDHIRLILGHFGLCWDILGYVGTVLGYVFVTHHLSPHHLSHTTLPHTIFRHTIFHTPLCHTPSFTHGSVTRSLSHTTFTHTIFHAQLCHTHTLSFFVTHHLSHTTLSHTTFFYFSILHHLLCLSFLPSPFVAHCWKKLACGVIRSFICVFVCLCVCFFVRCCFGGTILGSCWTMLNHFGLFSGICWPFFGTWAFQCCWVWSCWLLFWTWAFQCCWVLVLSLFILDLGISMSLSFGLVGLSFGLGHFSVVEFWSIQVVFQKNIVNTKQNAIFALCCWCFWCYFLFLVFPFSWGMLHLGYAGFIPSSCWEKIEPCWVVVASFSAHVGPMWSRLGLCWDRVGSCC